MRRSMKLAETQVSYYDCAMIRTPEIAHENSWAALGALWRSHLIPFGGLV